MPILMCPNCNVGMQELDRGGVVVDMCPQCRGVWLDRGELEKMLGAVRTEAEERDAAWRAAPPPSPPPRHYDDDDRHYRRHRDDDHYRHRKRRKSRLEEIFDIFD
ncbi:MAG: zf-TFIIB domain-containing protein [Rubellimicrobium sp.]|jgi:Zn-finger nucleic acid-binding protein|nr:zf-TFIIB domain-containing protein [Rubellimicrobium sp.]